MKNELNVAVTGCSAVGTAASRTKLAGLIIRKECWRLSWRGWVALLFAGIVLALTLQYTLYGFLAVADPVPPSECLVVEGWMQADELRQAYAEFKQGGYRLIITSGCRVTDQWDPKLVVTYADWAASKLRRIGVPNDLIQAVPSYVQRKDRTYSSAVAVREWMERQGIHVTQLNVVTEGAHARRSRLLFQKAFGSNVKIGVIPIEDEQFDPAQWWRTSEGVREVLGESIAYIYARCFFYP